VFKNAVLPSLAEGIGNPGNFLSATGVSYFHVSVLHFSGESAWKDIISRLMTSLPSTTWSFKTLEYILARMLPHLEGAVRHSSAQEIRLKT